MSGGPQLVLFEGRLVTASKRQRIQAMRRANTAHRLLIRLLGNTCAWCEATWTDSQLQIDHVDGRQHANHSAENRNKRWDVRVKAYWSEFWSGIRLRVLCKECNSKDGRARQLAVERAAADCPF